MTEPVIRPPAKYLGTLKKLKDELGLFQTYQKALMFAAALGYYRESREAPQGKKDAVDYGIFRRAGDHGFVDCLAVATANDLKVLSDERASERATIFEEFACAGLREIEEILQRSGVDPLDELIRLTMDAQAARPEELPGIDPSVLGMMENI